MKSRQLIARLNALLDNDGDLKKKEIKTLRKLLRELKDKERRLKKKLAQASDPEVLTALQTKIAVLYIQRMKGVERVKLLKKSECPSLKPYL